MVKFELNKDILYDERMSIIGIDMEFLKKEVDLLYYDVKIKLKNKLPFNLEYVNCVITSNNTVSKRFCYNGNLNNFTKTDEGYIVSGRLLFNVGPIEYNGKEYPAYKFDIYKLEMNSHYDYGSEVGDLFTSVFKVDFSNYLLEKG